MGLRNSQKPFALIDRLGPQSCSGNCFFLLGIEISLLYHQQMPTAMRLLCHHPTLEFLWMWDSLPYYQLSLFSVVRYFSDNRPLQQTCSNRTVFHGIHPDVTSQDSICHFMAVLFHYISLLSLCFNILCFDGPCRLLGRQPRMQSNSHVWMNR